MNLWFIVLIIDNEQLTINNLKKNGKVRIKITTNGRKR